MLIELSVRGLVLIDGLELRLAPGFNVLTGETGAGKSILVGALELVLGGRARPDLIRPGHDEAEVEALFDIADAPSSLKAELELAGFAGDELVLRRVVQASGRSRAYMNGRLCTASQLVALAPQLADIASQHESVALTDASTHLFYLDTFAKLAEVRDGLAGHVDDLTARSKAVAIAREAERGRAEREAFLRFQIGAIDEIEPRSGETQELAAERNRLRHVERLGELTRRAADRLYEKDDALCDELSSLAAGLDEAAGLDPSLKPAATAVASARTELVEAAHQLTRYAEGLEGDPGRLAEIDERLARLTKLVRRHGADIDDVLAAKKRMAAELDDLASSETRVAEAERDLESRLSVAAEEARRLSAARKRAAEELGRLISQELKALGMGGARVVVDVGALGASGVEWLVDGARLGRHGIDRVEFLIAPNQGSPPRPLARIASGGELSRALLALKRVLADGGPAGLYVFDEVDTGVGGAVAERIGLAMADVARHRQVLCITHLAPIAAHASTHFVVEKRDTKGQVVTSVAKVAGKERLEELARMLAGAKITPAARKAAEEMLRDAAQGGPPGQGSGEGGAKRVQGVARRA